MRVHIIIFIAVTLTCVSSCTRGYKRVSFGYEHDVVCLGIDKTKYPEENEDGEIPDSAWDGFKFQQEYFLVNPRDGKLISEKSFAAVSAFHDGIAVAEDESGACFFIDKSGKRVNDAVYKDATLFSDGRAWVRTFDGEIVAVDRKGESVFYAPEAVMVNVFYDGKSVIYTQNGCTKVVDVDGNELFEEKGHGGNFVVDGRIVIQGPEGQGVMSLDGDFVLAPKYKSVGMLQWADVDSYVDAVCDDRFVVLEDEGFGVVDRSGKKIVPTVYEDIVRDGDLFLAQSRGDGSAVGSAKWYDRDGKVVIDGSFTETYPFGDGRLAAAFDSGQWGFVDRNGKWVIEPRWAFVGTSMDANGVAVVYDNDSSDAGLLDESGDMVVDCEYSFITPLDGTSLYIVSRGEKVGIVGSDGHVVLPADRYDLCSFGNEGEDKHLYIHID
ncbi:MAG TPA: hypothetical protein DHU72_06820 [Rikenellaceae bacterium]|nr:hypothetical protein [Rikenellaceae bacterium]